MIELRSENGGHAETLCLSLSLLLLTMHCAKGTRKPSWPPKIGERMTRGWRKTLNQVRAIGSR